MPAIECRCIVIKLCKGGELFGIHYMCAHQSVELQTKIEGFVIHSHRKTIGEVRDGGTNKITVGIGYAAITTDIFITDIAGLRHPGRLRCGIYLCLRLENSVLYITVNSAYRMAYCGTVIGSRNNVIVLVAQLQHFIMEGSSVETQIIIQLSYFIFPTKNKLQSTIADGTGIGDLKTCTYRYRRFNISQ